MKDTFFSVRVNKTIRERGHPARTRERGGRERVDFIQTGLINPVFVARATFAGRMPALPNRLLKCRFT
ncbi:MAG TPA: hypothetical protein VNI84_00890 [Pyrinomonadaceae bacterium]|nr:hypothetical protein [Pyrinomonadaceae bacterium]